MVVFSDRMSRLAFKLCMMITTIELDTLTLVLVAGITFQGDSRSGKIIAVVCLTHDKSYM